MKGRSFTANSTAVLQQGWSRTIDCLRVSHKALNDVSLCIQKQWSVHRLNMEMSSDDKIFSHPDDTVSYYLNTDWLWFKDKSLSHFAAL